MLMKRLGEARDEICRAGLAFVFTEVTARRTLSPQTPPAS
jgi:hypothetical protein